MQMQIPSTAKDQFLYYWASKYQDGILNGTISVAKSVNEFLAEISDGSKS